MPAGDGRAAAAEVPKSPESHSLRFAGPHERWEPLSEDTGLSLSERKRGR